jgi:hypothetical protein
LNRLDIFYFTSLVKAAAAAPAAPPPCTFVLTPEVFAPDNIILDLEAMRVVTETASLQQWIGRTIGPTHNERHNVKTLL